MSNSPQRTAVFATTALLFLVVGLCRVVVFIVDTFLRPIATWN